MHQIGVGVLGPVFRTYDSDDHRSVALKAFYLDITPEQARILSAALDGIVHAGLSHPSIVTPLGAGLSDDVSYLALEYVVAESLDVAIRRCAPAAVETALPFVVQLADALDFAHALGLSHGALHLRDIFMAPQLPRVTGFGVVSALERVGLRGPLRRPYTAPEQIAGAEWGPPADRFALAAIAYELLTGKRVAGTGAQVSDRLARVSGVRNATGLTRLFAGALADKPEMRPASAREFADSLAGAVGWTGAGEVRQVLVKMDGDAGDAERQVLEPAPVIAVAGFSERPFAGVEGTGTEGAALAMTRRHRPERSREPALNWTEHTLDRGESEELREPEAYQPRPPGASLEERSGRAGRGAVPDLDRIDDVPENTLDDTFVASGDGDGRVPVRGLESYLGQLEPEPAAPVLDDDDGVDECDDDEDVPLSVIQDRYRSVDDIAEPERATPGSQAAGVYTGITRSDMKDGLGDSTDLREDDSDDDTAGGVPPPAVSQARDYDADGRDARSLDFESDGEHGDDLYGDDADNFRAGVVTSGWTDRARGVPVATLALIGVGITLAALVAGLGWIACGDDVATDEPPAAGTSAASSMVAGGLADRPDLAEAPPSSREFSEATVASPPVADPVEAKVETPAVPPTPSTAEVASDEPPVPEGWVRPASVAATEAPVAPVVNAPPIPDLVPARASGRLLVRSLPPGVRVAVNGAARGTTPLALANLSYGAYDIRLSLEGYEPQVRRLAISSDDPVAAIDTQLVRVAETRTASLGVGSVFVDTRPRGVEVWLDQQLVGETPMLIPNVSAGAHEVEFRYSGYRDWATTVQVGPSSQARVTASLDHAPR